MTREAWDERAACRRGKHREPGARGQSRHWNCRPLTNLTSGQREEEDTDAQISSLMDTWLIIRHQFRQDRRGRWIYVAKSRGMPHSQDRCELILSSQGISLRPLGPEAHAADSEKIWKT